MENPAIEIVPQERFSALADHATDSQPDIAIRLTEGEAKEWILVESKLQAKAGPDQLRRYAEQLAARTGLTRTALVFITRDFERVHEFEKLPANFAFKPTRWFQFYEILKAHVNGDGLATELKLFMEENKMAIRNQFRAVDTLALESFLGAKDLMDETLWGEVKDQFEAVLGKVSSRKRAMTQLADHARYIMIAGFGKKYDFQCLLGYYLPSGDPLDFINVGVYLESNPTSVVRKRVIEAFRDFSRDSKKAWKAYELDKEKEWSCIEKVRPLQTFSEGSDHIKAIKQYLLGIIKEVKQFKQRHPELPWADQAPEEKDEN